MKKYLFASDGLFLWNSQRGTELIEMVEVPNNNFNFLARAANENQKPEQHTEILLFQHYGY